MPELNGPSSDSQSANGSMGNDYVGVAFALLAASALGLAVALSRFAFEGGTNGLTVATSRGVLTVGFLIVLCVLGGKRMSLPRHQWFHAGGLGVLMAVMFWGNIAAVQYIPIGLAALLFYTYPPMVAVISAVVLRQSPGMAKTCALLAAFAGLGLMLGVSLETVDRVGVFLSLLAAGATAWNAVWLSRHGHGAEPLVLTLYMAVVAALVLLAIAVVTDGLVAPTTSGGWLGMLAAATTQSLAVPFYFLGIARIGAMRSAMFSNVQPVVSIGAAWLFFGDLLGTAQIVGGLVVLGAIFIVQKLDARRVRGQPANSR
jgi:drug/metabolite transporter (DMT)-like permease